MDREQSTTPAPPSLSDAMARIMAHPELISMVASVLGAPVADAPSESTESQTPLENASETVSVSDAVETGKEKGNDVIASLLPLLSRLSDEKGGERRTDDPRACLLRALKPYVSVGRREAIDTMIRLSQISDILKRMV